MAAEGGGGGGGAAAAAAVAAAKVRLVDIGANLLDDMFAGQYHGRERHRPDLVDVLARAREAGVERIVVTAGSLEDSRRALELCEALDPAGTFLSCTVGVHPTRAVSMSPAPQREALEAVGRAQAEARTRGEAEWWRAGGGEAEEETEEERDFAEDVVRQLRALAEEGVRKGRVVALGEMGLDYDRLHFAPRGAQLRQFRRQLRLCRALSLPLFLHNRATGTDFFDVLREELGPECRGVVHSFTGTADELRSVLEVPGLFVGVNGCSLKTAENCSVVSGIPLDRLLLETDAPWCSIKATHHCFSALRRSAWPEVAKPERHTPGDGCTVKGRAEPCHMEHVLQAVASVQGRDESAVADATWRNSHALFSFPS